MADPIRRLQSGNVQVTGISNLPQPNMNFGSQRPEIAYQAGAEASSVVGKVISNLSVSMFGQAEKLAEAAGAEFIAENPITQKELDAMVNGNKKSFADRFTQNAFGAAVNTWRSHELASYFELQSVQKANDYQVAIETGMKNGSKFELDLKAIAEDWKATTDGHAAVLAQYSPDASYKYRATAAVHGNKLLLAAAKADGERKFLENQVRVEQMIPEYGKSVRNIINRYADSDPTALQEHLIKEREATVNRALLLAGIPAQKLVLEKSAQIELEVKTAMFQTHIFEGNLGDSAAFMDKVRKGLLPPSLQNVWNTMTDPEKRKVRDAIDSEFTALGKRKEESKKVEDQEINRSISSNLMTLYDVNSSADAKLIASDYLTSIVLTRPDLMSAKTYADTLKSLEQDAVDDFEGLAMYDQWLRENANTITAPEALQKAIGLRVTGKTAIEKFEKYAPKDAKEVERREKLANIEFDIRTRKIPKDDKAALRNALTARNLTMADIPNDFIRLLTEELPDVEIKTNLKHDAIVSTNIQNGTIKTPLALYDYIENNKYIISPSDRKTLKAQLLTKLQQDAAVINSGASQTKDIRNSPNKVIAAQTEIEARQGIEETTENLRQEYINNGYFTNANGEKINKAPTARDGADFYNEKYANDKRIQSIKNQREALKDEFRPDSKKWSSKEQEKKPAFNNIQPTFKAQDPTKVDQNYIDKLTREMMRIKGVTDKKSLNRDDLGKIQEMIDAQEGLAKQEFNMRRR